MRNSGVAFGLPITGAFQIALTTLFIAGIFVYGLRFDATRKTLLSLFGYASILAGSLSNAFDRIIEGKVVDFIALKYFAIFNVADIFITIGAILLIISHIRYERATGK